MGALAVGCTHVCMFIMCAAHATEGGCENGKRVSTAVGSALPGGRTAPSDNDTNAAWR